MSTGSIKHNIVIDSAAQAERFVEALEKAELLANEEYPPKAYIFGERINSARPEPTVSIESNLLQFVPTCKLVDELEKREGVDTKFAEPYQDIEVKVNGPAVILTIID